MEPQPLVVACWETGLVVEGSATRVSGSRDHVPLSSPSEVRRVPCIPELFQTSNIPVGRVLGVSTHVYSLYGLLSRLQCSVVFVVLRQ